MLETIGAGLSGARSQHAAARRSTARRRAMLCAAVAAPGLLAAGCQKDVSVDMQDERQAAFVRMLLPRAVEIKRSTKPYGSQYVPGAGVERMTFEARQPSTGIEVMLEAKDAFGDPVKVLGAFNFELYSAPAGPASAKAGERIFLWRVELTPGNLPGYWERAPRLYKFPLQLDQPAALAPGHYVLEATYVSPWDDKLFATYDFDFRVAAASGGS